MKAKSGALSADKFIIKCIEAWERIPRGNRIVLLENGQYNPARVLKPEHAIANVIVTIYEVFRRFKRVCAATDADDKLVAYVDFSKSLDPRYGFLARRLSELALVLPITAYTKKNLDTLQNYFSALVLILKWKWRRCGRTRVEALHDTFEKTILPALTASTPEDYRPYVAACSAGFNRMTESLRGIAHAIRASIMGRPANQQCNDGIEAYLKHQVSKASTKGKSSQIKGYRSFSEWDKRCTTANLEPKKHSKYGGPRDKPTNIHLYGFRDPAINMQISNHEGYVLYAIKNRMYKITHPLAIAFIDFLIEANISKKDDGYVFVPIVVDEHGNEKGRSQFRNYPFKNRGPKHTAPFKEGSFWWHLIISKKPDGHKGPNGKVRLGERPLKDV